MPCRFGRRRGTGATGAPRRRWRRCVRCRRRARDLLARYHGSINDDALHRLAAALTAFVKSAAAERRRAGKLNFDDLLIEARRLVANNAGVRAALRDRLRFLLVDEFQDTDPLQAEMVFLLAADEPAAAGANADAGSWSEKATRQPMLRYRYPSPSMSRSDRTDSWQDVKLWPGKLFIVGDPKQSIYRFRRADIDTYLHAKEAFRRQPDGCARIATVSQNFRSVPEITEWVNATFAAVLKPDAQFRGAQPEYRPIHAYRAAAGQPRVTMMYPAADLHDTKLSELRRGEADAVARLIADLVGNPRWRIGAQDGTDGERAIALRDICILVETRTAVDVYTDALADHGVPYIVDGGRDFFQHQEISDVAAILRAVDDPSDPGFAGGSFEVGGILLLRRRPAAAPAGQRPLQSAGAAIPGHGGGPGTAPTGQVVRDQEQRPRCRVWSIGRSATATWPSRC